MYGVLCYPIDPVVGSSVFFSYFLSFSPDCIFLFVDLIAVLFLYIFEPLDSKVSHLLGVFLLLEPWLKVYYSHPSKIKVRRVVYFHKLMYFVDWFYYFVESRVKNLAGFNQFQHHRMQIDLKIFKSSHFIFIWLKNVKKYIVDGFILWKPLDWLSVFTIYAHKAKIPLAISQKCFKNFIVIILNNFHFFTAAEPMLGVGLHEFIVKGVFGFVFRPVFGRVLFILLHYDGDLGDKLLVQLFDCKFFLFWFKL